MKNYFILFLLLLLFGCSESNRCVSITSKTVIEKIIRTNTPVIKDSSELEKMFVSKNLINIHSIDSSIRVALHYSTTHNFLKRIIYQRLEDCYLPCDIAIKLNNAHYFLHQQFPNYNIIVFDAVRPLSAQKQMWDELDMPQKEKINYLAHPNDTSLHNFGAAVDVGIISNEHVLLDMGTEFDSFVELSKPKKENQFYKEGKLSKSALTNRLLLRKIMLEAGFMTITSEWWHFNSCTKREATKAYRLIE